MILRAVLATFLSPALLLAFVMFFLVSGPTVCAQESGGLILQEEQDPSLGSNQPIPFPGQSGQSDDGDFLNAADESAESSALPTNVAHQETKAQQQIVMRTLQTIGGMLLVGAALIIAILAFNNRKDQFGNSRRSNRR
ncbi:hypothetical protein [Mariniblastus fucicola]|uniref:Transmembrane protein n=1 Tax=Mariniblastus fucicola TaxID=980251 RepID=A0A5B9PER4_9BACT|nr:hypothetical protein [Mariniblastus fucicola]QEG23695.1 hypothetical protein MFFC18_35960 [Mariniblastus fucicola]